jgi:hypothetical protein
MAFDIVPNRFWQCIYLFYATLFITYSINRGAKVRVFILKQKNIFYFLLFTILLPFFVSHFPLFWDCKGTVFYSALSSVLLKKIYFFLDSLNFKFFPSNSPILGQINRQWLVFYIL